MLAIDVPIALLTGFALADAGKNMLKSEDPQKYYFMRTTVLLYTFFFLVPIPFYFFLGWPAWETNFLWRWPDNVMDSPLRASVSFAIFALTVGPAYLGFEIGRYFIKKDKGFLVQIGYVSMGLLVLLIVFLTRDITFNIASTYQKFEAGEFYSFWSHPFFTGWLLVTVYFWGSLVYFYFWVRKRDIV